MKNHNEYYFDDKLYIKSIKRCSCNKQLGDYFELECKIHQRGEHEYYYAEDTGYISRHIGGKKLWLESEALQDIWAAVECFCRDVSALRDAADGSIDIKNPDFTFYYKRAPLHRYNTLCAGIQNGSMHLQYNKNTSIDEMIWGLRSWYYDYNDIPREAINAIINSSRNDIKQNPIYNCAVQNNDELLKHQLLVHYSIADKKECSWLAKFTGNKILPPLPEEYNRYYIVDTDTVDTTLLHRSGYTILHRPYFSMHNSTHKKWMLNPHTKEGVDAAADDAGSMAFSDFLELFENTK